MIDRHGKGDRNEQYLVFFAAEGHVRIPGRREHHTPGHRKDGSRRLFLNPHSNRRGEYRGTLTEGDLLWALKYLCFMDMRQAELHRISEISRRKDNVPVRVTTSMTTSLTGPPPRISYLSWTTRMPLRHCDPPFHHPVLQANPLPGGLSRTSRLCFSG